MTAPKVRFPRGRKRFWLSALALFQAAVVLVALWHGRFDTSSPTGPGAKPSVLAAPNEFRAQIVKEVSSNSPNELLDKLVENYNDVAWASTGFGHSYSSPLGTYAWSCLSVTKLARVRRILQEFRENPTPVIPKLKTMLSDAANGFAPFYADFDNEFRRRILADESQTKPFPARDEHFRRSVNAQVAVYLLAEFHVFDSLPLLNRVYEQPGILPVPRLYLFYAMHVLILDHPTPSLTEAAREARRAYLEATGKKVPVPKTVSVTAWNASLDDGDVRAALLKRDIGLDQMPQIRLREYPLELSKYDDAPLGSLEAKALAPELHKWHTLMERFIQAQYSTTD